MFPVAPSNKAQPQAQPRPQPRRQAAAEENADQGDEEPPTPLRREGSRKTKEMPESTVQLSSIKDLRKQIVIKEHQGISAKFIFHAMLWF